MDFEKILIRFGELSLKGKNKMTFIKNLSNNIVRICNLNKESIETQIDRIFIPYSEENMSNLKYVFGIVSFSPVLKCKSNLQEIEKVIKTFNWEEINYFKINARRKWKEFSLNSMELNNYFGSLILKHNPHLKVKVKDPDKEICIEIHKEYSYIFWNKAQGLGGLPVGSSGKSLHLLSGGIDSPVAALEMMKRGVKVDFLSFISPPHTDGKTVEKLIKLVTELNRYQISTNLYLCNYTDIMNYISLTSNQSYKIILMRRSFYRIASQLANINNCLGISNGENLGQVASQTMEAMKVIHEQSQFPIYQPLLTNDKIETIKKSEKFNLFSISTIKACETCELFAPSNPSTKPSIEIAKKLENELPMLMELELKALESKIKKQRFRININK